MMKAILLAQPGSTDHLLLRDIPVPTLQPEEVLVKVQAISINPVDVKTRKGVGMYRHLQSLPEAERIIGWDISGVVTASRSDLFKVGQEVFGMVNFPGAGKAYAEYVAAPASHLALKPLTISHAEAAAATLAPLTAWQVLVAQVGIKQGDRVLIHAASGGVGHYAVQIARHLGAYVIGTSSAANKDFVLSMGAHEHIDYRSQTLKEATKDIDFVLDCLGQESVRQSLEVLRDGGKIISIVGGVTSEILQSVQNRNISGSSYLVQSSGRDMHTLAQLLANGTMKSHISRTFDFERMADVHAQIESGRTVGKIAVML